MTLLEKLQRPSGLCTSVCKNRSENADRIKAILDASLDDQLLQKASRSNDDWNDVHGLPMDFKSFRYRFQQ